MRERFAPKFGMKDPFRRHAGVAHQWPQRPAVGCEGTRVNAAGNKMNCRRTPALAVAGAMALKAVLAVALLATAASIVMPGVRLYAEAGNSDFKAGQNAEARE